MGKAYNQDIRTGLREVVKEQEEHNGNKPMGREHYGEGRTHQQPRANFHPDPAVQWGQKRENLAPWELPQSSGNSWVA